MKLVSTKNQFYLLAIVLIVAAILRFNHINQPFIDTTSWRESDNATIADNFYRGNWNIFYPGISWNGPEPNYLGYEFQTVTYIAALLYVLFGQHDWVARSVPVMFGLWGIFALYQLVLRVWDKERAIASAAVMALLPGSIYVDRTFISDPVMTALVTTSCWFIVAYLQNEHLHYLLLASAFGTWGFLTKVSGLIVGIPMLYAMLAILGYKRMLHPRKLYTIAIAAGLTLASVTAYYLWARHIYLTYPPHHIANAGNWLWDHGLAKWLREKYYFSALYEHFRLWIWTKPAIALVFVGLFLSTPQGQRNSHSDRALGNTSGKAPWLFHWWMVGGVIYYLIGAKGLVDNPHNFQLINPAGAALAGGAIVAIASFAARRGRSPASVATIAAILLIIGGVGHRNLKSMYNPYAEQSYKLGLALRQISQPGDLVATIPTDIGNPVAIYYSQRRGWIFPPAWSNIPWWDDLPKGEDKALIANLDQLRAQGADWLGIVNEQKNKIWQSNPIFVEYIQRTCELKQESPDWLIYRILPQKQ
jgi:Dolichyl-phosphate-mannose-protein mannosyltransferase